ncbi:hypothetical protein [Paenibacillus sp. DR312]|uniref:hypothetical protein n=1 Tax=unclassified Paenibacillus TaxID=185978 RepID=UPI001C94DA51|nr:hypothetical protein [Paenibacillus sp. DR312]QZN76184.1 hypothetical protein K5K90_02425 [Paenibacillus sp. DR312]
MEIEYSCKVVRYNSGEDFKTDVVLIFDFLLDSGSLRKLLKHLTVSSMYIPIKTIAFIDENIGKLAEFYHGDITSRAKIEFIDSNNFSVSFRNDVIKGSISNKALKQWDVKSVEEMLAGDTLKSVILTNYSYGQKHAEATDAYHISLRLQNGGRHDV